MSAIEIRAVANMRCKKAQLACRATALSLKPRFGKPRFGTAQPGDVVPPRVYLFGDGLKERRPLFAACPSVGRERLLGGPDRTVDVVRAPF